MRCKIGSTKKDGKCGDKCLSGCHPFFKLELKPKNAVPGTGKANWKANLKSTYMEVGEMVVAKGGYDTSAYDLLDVSRI